MIPSWGQQRGNKTTTETRERSNSGKESFNLQTVVKEQILSSISSILGKTGWKVLVVDEKATSIINSVCRMTDLTSLGVSRMYSVLFLIHSC
jgi:hypothetical protein